MPAPALTCLNIVGDGLRPVDGKGEDVGDVAGSGCQHHQPVHSEGDAGAVGEAVLEGAEEPLVDRRLG